MAKIAGRWVSVSLDDVNPLLRDISTDVESIDIPDEYGEIDVTGFMDGVENSIPGLPRMPVELTGHFDTTTNTGLYTVLKGIVGVYASKTLTVKIGSNTTPTTNDPQFSGEFWCQKMNITANPKGGVKISASLRPYGAVAPAWGVVPA
jgi:hypothetical protein